MADEVLMAEVAAGYATERRETRQLNIALVSTITIVVLFIMLAVTIGSPLVSS